MITEKNPVNHPEPSAPTEPTNHELGGQDARIRPDIWSLDKWEVGRHPSLVRVRYRGDAEAPDRGPNQLALSGGDPCLQPSWRSLRGPADQLASTDNQQRFWNQYQHGSWYFLLWHRMYLGYFEQIVAATVHAARWSGRVVVALLELRVSLSLGFSLPRQQRSSRMRVRALGMRL